MEVETLMCDDRVLDRRETSREVPRRVWFLVGATVLIVTTLAASRESSHHSDLQGAISLYSYPWFPAWRRYADRVDTQGCTRDGDDCRYSRCCMQAGSTCFVKNRHWASCNETCQYNRKWEAGPDKIGHWVTKSHHVWECSTLSRATTAAPTTAAPTVVVDEPVKVETTKSPYTIYDERTDFRTQAYGQRDASKSVSAVASTPAPITWEGEQQ